MRGGRVLVCALTALIFGCAAGNTSASTLAVAGGGWSWFGDPRAVVRGNNLFLGWITSAGNVDVGRMNLTTGGWAQARLRGPIEVDDHSNPSLTMLPDGRLVAFYSPHSGRLTSASQMWYRVATRPGSVVNWGRERTVPVNSAGSLGYTYPNPVWSEGYLYLFWRGADWQPTFSRTRDLRSWAPARTLLHGERGARPYVKYDAFGDSIRFVYTGSHPDSSKATNLYFGQLQAGAVRTAGGRVIASRRRLPFDYRKGQLVYSWHTAGAAWGWDIAHDATGHPVIVYATIQSAHEHTYRYARWTGTEWYDRALVTAGPSIDHDPGYSGGITLDHSNPDIVYLSRKSGDHFEIERWQTADGGHTFTTVPVTTDSTRDNIRPFVPEGTSGDRVLLWTWGSYVWFKTFADLVVMLRTELPAPALSQWQLQRGTRQRPAPDSPG